MTWLGFREILCSLFTQQICRKYGRSKTQRTGFKALFFWLLLRKFLVIYEIFFYIYYVNSQNQCNFRRLVLFIKICLVKLEIALK